MAEITSSIPSGGNCFDDFMPTLTILSNYEKLKLIAVCEKHVSWASTMSHYGQVKHIIFIHSGTYDIALNS